jgi:lipopolysaccharide biosynthesis glycosyltransferase
MRYYATLVGASTYAFNKQKFIKYNKVEVTKEAYDDIKQHAIFFCEAISDGTTDDFDSSVELKERMNIVLAYSPNWAPYVQTEVYSLFKNNPPPIKVFLLSDKMGDIDLNPICNFFGNGYSYEFINVEELYNKHIPTDLNVSTRFTKYTLYRLLMPMIIPVDRVLYIDTDALVCSNIKDFYHMDLGDNILAGVLDIGSAMPVVRKGIDFSNEEVYINAGVCLMDLAKIRKLNLMDTWLKMVNTRFYNCHDQDILNITCRGRIQVVTNNYNSSLSTGFNADVKIAHYAGKKPWQLATVHSYKLWSDVEKECRSLQLSRIPKRIHYCWFGGKPKPELIVNCLNSWKEHMPDYDIIEWNETNFDVNKHGEYARKAASEKKWAFVTDYVRLWALHHYGGVYMDGDVQVFKPLDRFLVHRAFTGHETPELLVTATMGAEAEHPWITTLLNYYSNVTFNSTPNTQSITKISRPFIEKQDMGFTYLKEGVVIYPVKTFCSYDHRNLKPILTNESYTIHLFAGTWLGRTKV